MSHVLHCGDALDVLPTLADASVDAVVTDPPYPEIDREYGRWTEAEWFALMDRVVPECRRVLKPKGSAVFILQPNSERVGRMRTWLWRFLVQWGEAWGVVQDAYWWNTNAPTMTKNDPNLLRASVRNCVWLGMEDCYRDGESVLWSESDSNAIRRTTDRADNTLKKRANQKLTYREAASRSKALVRGGVTPFNLIPFSNAGDSGPQGHPAATPIALMRWWVRYVTPPRGVVLDPFAGSGTLAVACACEGRDSVLVERYPKYQAIIRRRLADLAGPLFAGGQP